VAKFIFENIRLQRYALPNILGIILTCLYQSSELFWWRDAVKYLSMLPTIYSRISRTFYTAKSTPKSSATYTFIGPRIECVLYAGETCTRVYMVASLSLLWELIDSAFLLAPFETHQLTPRKQRPLQTVGPEINESIPKFVSAVQRVLGICRVLENNKFIFQVQEMSLNFTKSRNVLENKYCLPKNPSRSDSQKGWGGSCTINMSIIDHILNKCDMLFADTLICYL